MLGSFGPLRKGAHDAVGYAMGRVVADGLAHCGLAGSDQPPQSTAWGWDPRVLELRLQALNDERIDGLDAPVARQFQADFEAF